MTAMVKAGAAGLFAANRLNAGRKLIDADPTLCKALKEPVDALWTSMTGLAGKFRKGEVNPADIDSVSTAIDGVKSDASEKADTTIKNRQAPGF
ncbi:hypothetical protein [Spirillospora sp. NPDC047279]|uniref:hypothetical protein n=1 Tax=Spirillospora sp. NPDC047279 TaxID=3155478 RepID=UPI0033C4ABDC